MNSSINALEFPTHNTRVLIEKAVMPASPPSYPSGISLDRDTTIPHRAGASIQLVPVSSTFPSSSSLASSHTLLPRLSPAQTSSLLKQRPHDTAISSVTPDQSSLKVVSVADGPGIPGGGRRGTISKDKGRTRWDNVLPWSGSNGESYVAEDAGDHGEDTEPLITRPRDRIRPNVDDGWNRGDEGELGILIERPTTPQISSSSIFQRPYTPPPPVTVSKGPLAFLSALRSRLDLFALQTGSLILSSIFLAGVVTYALTAAFFKKTLPSWFWKKTPPSFEWDEATRWKDEVITNDPAYYARQVGFDLENLVVETEDGFLLRLQRVVPPNPIARSDGRGGYPILLMHGLFQSSGSFITSEERSLAFWLAKQGYQVFLGNTRGVFGMGHKTYSRGEARFWDWTIRELALYDLPALVEEVRKLTGYDQIAFIGHSQGNGTAFTSLSLGICPELGPKLSVFIALAPAVFAGPLTHGFPFTTLGRMDWKSWRRFFGVLDFIPIMTWAYDYAPQSVFAFLGYTMFSFLFDWTDANWLARRKGKMFRFTPSPVSSASIFWWAGKGGFATRKCLFDTSLDRWFDHRFPPLSIYHGGRDLLVLTEPLLKRLEEKEPDVQVIRIKKIDLSEHCDFYWAAEAVEWCYHDIVEDIERTRPRYPEEANDTYHSQHDKEGFCTSLSFE
ncbi:Triglyceride lipase-cholesterol esterase [Phaffia rhodozyma]|uniref:Triglyceride lipase-cholesterol esterase n=1 Tax=Phaffia rhodozyma TaxID=264483 RepID=A0A0F7SLY5_PHARH|nr:Triglyceride lipase-cholesterol esterase [Phaffia rhodozyma]